MERPELPWMATGDGLVLRIRLTPKSSRDAVEGIEDTAEGAAIRARVRAVPSDGEANAALTKLIASWLGVPKSSISLVSGGKSRIKSVAVRGQTLALMRDVAARLGH
ncbi:MAG: DUF167 domain-containing protein [Hyphomicrobiaceae bacterium]|nr:DUF167 domain-containing protein [Hyphomicrobiaceae bacterium]